MTNILALCSALNNTYVALQIGNRRISKILKSDEKNYHSLYLVKEIKNICEQENFELKNLDMVATNLGPGSFTGIRVSLTVAKVISAQLNLHLVGLNSAEILLEAFGCDYLIMDARRDMYYLADKNKIELIYKDKMPDLKGKILTDKRSSAIFNPSICYEDYDKDLGLTIIELAHKKYNSSKNKEEFNYINVNANYIQTPPVFS